MAKIELMIDIGSKNITVYKKDTGIILKEPTIVAVSSEGKKTDFVAAGSEVRARLSRGDNLQVVYPIKAGVVEHVNGAIYLFRDIFNKISNNRTILKPKIAVIAAVSCGIDNADKLDIENVLLKAGASSVTIVESPIAVSRNVDEDSCFVVDIGASKTEVAYVRPNGIVIGCSVDVGGDELNKVIVDHIVDEYHVAVPERTIEKLRIKIATMFDNDASSATVSGRSIIDGKPKTVRVSSNELMDVMSLVFKKIAETVFVMIENVEALSDKFSEDIRANGIYLSGGVARIAGLETYLTNLLDIKVTCLDNPDDAVVNGGATFFYNKDALATMLNIKNLK